MPAHKEEPKSEPKVSLPEEFHIVREQLKDHYEAQIKGLLNEIVKQKELLEVSYAEKLAKDTQAKDQQIVKIS